MTLRILCVLFLSSIVPFSGFAAETRTLEIDCTFAPPNKPDITHTGFKLYQDGKKVCDFNDPTDTPLVCDVVTEAGAHNFTLTALYNGDIEGPHSPAFPVSFESGTTPPDTTPPDTTPPDMGNGSKSISYSWDIETADVSIAGYRMYMNDSLLCESSQGDITNLNCYTDLINGPMAFAIASYDTNNIESEKSNFLVLNPDDHPDLFADKTTTFTWDYISGASNAGGFKVFSNGEYLCQTTDPSARELSCELDNLAGVHTFAIAAVDGAGNQSIFSNSLVYTEDTNPGPNPNPGAVDAIIAVSPANGPAPLSVSFDGSGSSGDIASYSWDFGDGLDGAEPVMSHVYTTPGSYQAKLVITTVDGKTDSVTRTIVVEDNSDTPDTPDTPEAVILLSAISDHSPNTVTFDGSNSKGDVKSFAWDFGDGLDGAGPIVSHVYTTPGNYLAKLLITTADGKTDTTNVAVVISDDATPNKAPTAVIETLGTTQGEVPLIVSFNGSNSSDSDGSVVSYNWDMGDGSSANGASVQHTFSAAGQYLVTLQVTDNRGATSNVVSRVISVGETLPETDFIYEIGEISVDKSWVRAEFENSFSNPVVLVSPTTCNDSDPVTVKVRNLDQTGFELRLQEWQYQDGSHQAEIINYIVLEQGITSLTDGTKIEIGTFIGNGQERMLSFQQDFLVSPVIMTTVITDNDAEAVAGRITESSTQGFTYILQEQEASSGIHADETIAYLAWEPGSGIDGELAYEAQIVSDSVTDQWYTLNFQSDFSTLPFLFAEVQSQNEMDPVRLMLRNLDSERVELHLQEEQSSDDETSHSEESVGYLILGSEKDISPPDEDVGPDSKMLTFTWNSTAEYGEIAALRFYMNGTLICETANTDVGSVECYATLIDDEIAFTMRAVYGDGSESQPANLLVLDNSSQPDPKIIETSIATFTWEYRARDGDAIQGFRVYNNGQLVCKTDNPDARAISCDVVLTGTADNFSVKAIDYSGVETEAANVMISIQ